MRLVVEGGGEVTLGQQDFVARGGEGTVYARAGTAYKVWDDPARVVPAAKLRELAAIRDPRVIRPERRLLDPRGAPVGITMRHVSGGWVLGQLLTRAFRHPRFGVFGIVPDSMSRGPGAPTPMPPRRPASTPASANAA